MIKNYFVCANTAKGFQNYFSSNLVGMKKIFILKGGPGTGKSTLMKKIGTLYNNMNFDVEYIHCSSDVESLDGVIIRKLGVAIVDGTAPHVIEPTAPGALEEYVHLGTAWNLEELEKDVESILKLQKEIKCNYEKMYDSFEKAIKVHDEWEKIYISEMDFHKADQLTLQLIDWIFGEMREGMSIRQGDSQGYNEGTAYHRFFGATTPSGPVDYIDNITEQVKVRYFIKGRPGTGKSSMLKKISNEALARGFDVEIYHCAFDPNSLDMLVFPKLKVAIFDSTAPHEYYPSREGDIIVDVYREYITPGTDEKYEDMINEISKRYQNCIQQAKAYLGNAKCCHDDLERYYVRSTDFSKINQIRKDLINKIQKIQIRQMIE